MNQLIAWIAEQESFLFQDISFSLLLMLSIYLFIIFCFRWIENKTINKFKYMLIVIIFIQIIYIFEEYKTASYNELIIFNKSRASVLAIKENLKLTIMTNNDLLINNSIFKNYLVGSGVPNVQMVDSLRNVHEIGNQKLLIVDSLGIYKANNFAPDMVLLSHSPKINLERLIDQERPNLIIADASNYKSYIDRWENTCLKKGIKFYNTARKGAFIKKHETN